MNSLTEISAICHKQKIKTITLDVFDTVLLRKIHPEEQQFLLVATQWLPLLQEKISPKITVEKVLYWRQYIREELFDINNKYVLERNPNNQKHYDVTLDAWFSNLIVTLAANYNVELTTKTINHMVEKMITIELETEIANLQPNHKLITVLTQLKQTYNLKLYFVSDMYLTTAQVQTLLAAHHVDCFDAGITSTDAGYVKWDASLFYHLADPEFFGTEFDLFTNLHVGDNRNSDYLMPLRAGSQAVWLAKRSRQVAHTAQRGQKNLAKTKQRIVRRELNQLRQELDSSQLENQIWQKYGELFSLPLLAFLMHVGTAAKNAPSCTFLLVSSEAKLFKGIADQHLAKNLSHKNVLIADQLNRATMLRAIIWQLMQHNRLEVNLKSILEHVGFGETDGSRIEIYQFIFGNDFPCSELNLNLRSQKEFLTGLYFDLANAAPQYQRGLRNAYDYVLELTSRLRKRVVVVDVGWGGTVQTLLNEFCKNLGQANKITGLYLGAHPADRFAIKNPALDGYLLSNVRDGKNREIWNAVIWEYAYTNKIQFVADKYRLKLIRAGIDEGARFFQNITLSPYEYFFSVSKKCIRRLLQNPTRKEVRNLGNIEFDMGFVDFQSFHIVNLGYSQKEFYKLLLRHPRHTIKEIIFMRNCWPAGYLKYYRLYGVKTLLRIYGKLRDKHYI